MPIYQAARVVKDGATYAKNGATRVAMFLPSACGALQSGAQSLDYVVERIANDKVKVALSKQLYDQAWLRDNPPPYMVAITEESNALRAQLIQMIDDQGEVKKRVILIEVDEKIKTAINSLKTQFKDFFAQNARDSLPTVARRLARLELEVRGGPDNNAGINKTLVDLTRRVLIIEQSAPNPQANDTSADGRCCRHCIELKVVKADLKALVQRLWNPKKGEIDFQKMWDFCNWAGPHIDKKFSEYDSKFKALDGMTAAAQQPRENPCRCDQKAIDALTANFGGHDQRIKDIESLSPRVSELWNFCKALETERIPKLIELVDTEFQKLDTRLSTIERQVKPESLKSLVDAAVKSAVADVKATYDGEIKSMRKSMEAEAKAAVAKEKATFDDEVKRIENSVKDLVEAAVADLAAKKDEQIQGLKAENTQLHSDKAALEGRLEAKDQELKKKGEKIEEQSKKIAEHDRKFDAIAIEQTEQNDRLSRLEQRLHNGGGQNFTGPEQQQQPPQNPEPPSQAPLAPQGNRPFTPSPSPPHQGSQDNQGTSGKPMDVVHVSVDGSQSEADLLDFDHGDDNMEDAPGGAAQPAPQNAPSAGPQAPTQPDAQNAPTFNQQPPSQPDQMGGQQPSFGQSPASSPSGPTEPQPPAVAAPTPSIFGNVGQASASDPKINWGAKLGDINFANLNQPPAGSTAPGDNMSPAGPASFSPWAGGSIPSLFPQASSASGPGAPAPVAPMSANDAPSSTPSGFPSAPPQSSASPGTAPAGGFDFNMPLPPVSAGPVAPGTDFGAAFQNMTFPNGRIINPGQQLNEHGRPVIQPRSIRRQPTAQPQASSPVAAPASQPGRNLNACVEDAPAEGQDVHMDMDGQAAGQNANPVAPAAPEATMDSEPSSPVPTQPFNSGADTTGSASNQSQQSVRPAVSNIKFSLDVYEKWRDDVRARHADFSKVSGNPSRDYERQQRENRVWLDNLNMWERKEGDKLIKELGAFQAKTKGCSKDEMSNFMRTWLRKVFYQAGVQTSDKDRQHIQGLYNALSDEAKASLSSEETHCWVINPATPDATARNEPAPVPAQPSVSGAVAETAPQQSQLPVQQTFQNTRYSLNFYTKWRLGLWQENQDVATLAGMTSASDMKKLEMNNKWPLKLSELDDRADLTTLALLDALNLTLDVQGYTRDEMYNLMSLWMKRVFIVALADVSGKDQDDFEDVYSALLSATEEQCLAPQCADVA